MKYLTLILVSSLLLACGESLSFKAPDKSLVEEQFSKGNFTEAGKMIGLYLANDSISEHERYEMNFKLELMERIRKDFTKKDTFVIRYIKEHYPEVTEAELKAWEVSNALENMTIDGEKWYFNSAARNLFRIDKEAAKRYKLPNGGQSDSLNRFLEWYIPRIVAQKQQKGFGLSRKDEG